MRETVFGNKSLDRFDALVIGSGPTGSAVASILTAHGQKVLVLEAGVNYFQGIDDPAPGMPRPLLSNDEIKMANRGLIERSPLIAPRSFRPNAAAGVRTAVGSFNQMPQTVGGGSSHADMKFPRFQSTDFELGSRLGAVAGASFADWPISYAQLEPFYTYIEYSLGVQGQDGGDPHASARSRPFPMPPGPLAYSAILVGQGAAKLGYKLFSAPAAVNSRPYGGRPACRECGFCGGFGCTINAKGTSAVVTLRKALLSGNCQLQTETRALRLIRDGGGTTITGVEVLLPDGSRRTLTADRYILACNAIEDARLVLLSEPGGIGNSSDLVGRHLMFHSIMVAFGVFDERVHTYRGRTATAAITDFRGVPGDPQRPLGGIVLIGGAGRPIDEALQYHYQLRVGLGGPLKALMRQGLGRDHGATLSFHGEDAPQLTNRVDLDPELRDIDGLPVPRITYQAHDFETSAQAFYAPKLLDILMAAGARYAAILPQDALPQTAHLHGTLRFGTDPKTAVCRPDGRFHDIGNLYACGGALFPTSSGYNPTLTMVSLATRIACEMVSPGNPEQALPPLT